MGLKDWLDWLARRGRSRVEPDAVWLTAAGRLAGLCERARRQAREEAQVLPELEGWLRAIEPE